VKRFISLSVLVAAGAVVPVSLAQGVDVIVDGWTGCERATNGRAYCQRLGSTNYQPVPEDIYHRYVRAKRGDSTPDPVNRAPAPVLEPTGEVLAIVQKISAIQSQVRIFEVLRERQGKQLGTISEPDDVDDVRATVKALSDQIDRLKSSLREAEGRARQYRTPIRPEDYDKHSTARKLSEIYPRIPYYIPGTKETGEFWFEPVVKDNGTLIFKFRFVDAESIAPNKVRSTIEMTPEDVSKTQAGLLKAARSSKVVHAKKIRRNLRVRMDCFPESECPEEGRKLPGKSSSEIIFQVYENGSTAARIQRNKGLFEEGYNMSMESARCLAAYIQYVMEEAKMEFDAGSKSDEEVKKLFR